MYLDGGAAAPGSSAQGGYYGASLCISKTKKNLSVGWRRTSSSLSFVTLNGRLSEPNVVCIRSLPLRTSRAAGETADLDGAGRFGVWRSLISTLIKNLANGFGLGF